MSTRKKTEIKTETQQERFSKSAFLAVYLHDRDVLDALLEGDDLYTHEEVETLLSAYKNKEVM